MLEKGSGLLMVRLNGCPIHYGNTLIEATFMAIIEFLEYQKEKQSKL